MRGLGAADLGLALLLVAAIVLGGGGSPAPLPEMLLEPAALAIMVAVVWLDRDSDPWPRFALGFAAALLVLPALQLIPLPPGLWQALPGRDAEISALALVGAEQRWMPWSVSPSRTLAALLALVPPAIALLLAARASRRGRRLALGVLLAMTLVSAALGVAQLAGGPNSGLRFYAHSHVDNLVGFQANRNAQADVLLIGLLTLGALLAARRGEATGGQALLGAAAAATLGIAILLTGSRFGVALLALFIVSVAAWQGATRLTNRLRAAGVVAIAALSWIAASSYAVTRIVTRFAAGEATRPELWRDTLYAIGQYWPFGSGLGTFVPVFFAAERLEFVDASVPNRAHNDYLELALEAGLPGLMLAAALAMALAWRLVVRWRGAEEREARAEVAFSAGVLALLAAHSLVDYPLRSMALAVLAGAAAGLILAPAQDRTRAASGDREGTREP